MVPAADLQELTDAMDALCAAMHETLEELGAPGKDCPDLRAAYDYLWARAGLAVTRCSALADRGRSLQNVCKTWL